MKGYMTVEEACTLLGVGRKTFYAKHRWRIATGRERWVDRRLWFTSESVREYAARMGLPKKRKGR